MPAKHSHSLKVVTCCYCGARSTLAPQGGQRLVCHGCGAPIRQIEAVAPKPMPRPGAASGPKPAIRHRAEAPGEHLAKDRPIRRKKGRRRKGGLLRRLSKVVDDLDLDDIFDVFD